MRKFLKECYVCGLKEEYIVEDKDVGLVYTSIMECSHQGMFKVTELKDINEK